jgi:hypothetical protein
MRCPHACSIPEFHCQLTESESHRCIEESEHSRLHRCRCGLVWSANMLCWTIDEKPYLGEVLMPGRAYIADVVKKDIRELEILVNRIKAKAVEVLDQEDFDGIEKILDAYHD